MRALLLSPSHLNFDPGALSSVIKRRRAERRVLLLGRCYSDNSGNNLFAAPFAAIVSLLYPIGRRSRSSLAARSIKGILRLLEEGATMSLAPTLLFSDCSSQTDRRTTDIAKTEEGQRVACVQIQRQVRLEGWALLYSYWASLGEYFNAKIFFRR